MNVPTHAISIHQPWAELIRLGLKTVEFRSWPLPNTGYGWVALHATAWPLRPEQCPDAYDLLDGRPLCATAAIIAVINLNDCITPQRLGIDERIYDEPGCPLYPDEIAGDWHGWAIAQAVPIAPITCRGYQRFWRLPDPIRAQLAEALAEAGSSP